MKRLYILLAIAACTLSMQAETYTILFNSNQSGSDGTKAITAVENLVLTATYNCVVDFSGQNVYRAKEGYGVKLGTTSKKGEMTLVLDRAYDITRLTVWAAAMDIKDSTSAGIVVMGETISWQAPSLQLKPYVLSKRLHTNELTLSSARASYGRLYIQKVEIEIAEEGQFGQIEMPQYPEYKFASTEYDPEQAAEDAEVFAVRARHIDAAGLQLRMASGKIFSVSPATLPAEGGDLQISYQCDYRAYGVNDTLIVSGLGLDGQQVSHRMPVSVTIYQYVPKPVDSTGMQIAIHPGDYYQPIEGLQDSVLKSTLGQLINCGVRYRYGSGKDHTWDAFWYTDRDTLTNQVLDMYSNNLRYFNPERPTASVAEFDIEHMFPKSWWGGTVNKAYCDLYHLVPGDYSANRSKSNHAPGIPTDSTFWNGSFATGADDINGLGRVFCPADEYKGDFARAYFYIACCYGDSLTWVSTGEAAEAMTNTDWHEFQPRMWDLLLDWHRMDPVSRKETDRAIQVNKIQGNRNPFIDYPELVEFIWGDKQGQPVEMLTLTCTMDEYLNMGTSIEMTEATPMWQKMLKNGQIVLIYGNKTYTILGQSAK